MEDSMNIIVKISLAAEMLMLVVILILLLLQKQIHDFVMAMFIVSISIGAFSSVILAIKNSRANNMNLKSGESKKRKYKQSVLILAALFIMMVLLTIISLNSGIFF
jgi:preprotein translocase subunit SecF